VNTGGLSEAEATSRAADAVSDLIARLGLPQHLAAYGPTESDLEAARPVSSPGTPLEDLVQLSRAAW
jgi:alcohol dehydrogenase class IV